MTSALHQEHPHKIKVFIAFSGHSTKHNCFEEMDNSCTPFPSTKKPVSTSNAFTLPETSAPLGLFIAFFLVPKYSKNDFQRILKAVIEARTAAIATMLLGSPWERSPRTRFSDIYRGKSYLECYNLCQFCKNHFAIARAKGANCILFITSFFSDQVYFCWQRYKYKLEDETTVSITWNEFKVFLCHSLRKPHVFVDDIW